MGAPIDGIVRILFAGIVGARVDGVDGKLNTGDGRVLPAQISMTPSTLRGMPSGMTLIAVPRNVSEGSSEPSELELQSLNADLIAQKAKLEEQNESLSMFDKMKDQFLASTTHELKTPLNGIIGLTDILIRQTQMRSGCAAQLLARCQAERRASFSAEPRAVCRSLRSTC